MLQVRRQCSILLASTVVPLLINALGFSAFVGALGVIYYMAFLLFSITRPDEYDDPQCKKVDDVEDSEAARVVKWSPAHALTSPRARSAGGQGRRSATRRRVCARRHASVARVSVATIFCLHADDTVVSAMAVAC